MSPFSGLDGGAGLDRLEGDSSRFLDVFGVPDRDYLDGGAENDELFGGGKRWQPDTFFCSRV